MDNISLLEECYKKYSQNLGAWLPDGITEVNLELLHELDLLKYYNSESHDPALTRYFHVIETEDKITLINEEFIVWIVPDNINEMPKTYTLIALNSETSVPKLEMAFVTTGVYNTSRLVLRVLEKYLKDIQEYEEIISSIKPKNEEG